PFAKEGSRRLDGIVGLNRKRADERNQSVLEEPTACLSARRSRDQLLQARPPVVAFWDSVKRKHDIPLRRGTKAPSAAWSGGSPVASMVCAPQRRRQSHLAFI